MTARSLVVVSGGLGQPSSTRLLADRMAAATERALDASGIGVSVETIELREIAGEITNMLITGFAATEVRRAIDRVIGADGVVAVTPIFSASYSGLFKSFFDILDEDALTAKPVLIGATGGTARHSLALDHALRPLFTYLRAVVLPTGVYAATEDWGAAGNEGLTHRIDRAAGELAAILASTAPRSAGNVDAGFTSFDELLGRG